MKNPIVSRINKTNADSIKNKTNSFKSGYNYNYGKEKNLTSREHSV